MTQNRLLFPLLIGSFLGIQIPLQGDPPENKNAWTSAPHGWHLDQLGPRTEPVDPESFTRVYHVSAEVGNDDRGDGAANSPFRSLGRALARAGEVIGGSERVAILVAAGTYTETPYVLSKGIHLYGGFDPVDWRRDIHDNRTVLDARQKGRVLVGANDSTINGFTITGGKVVGHGAGLYCYESSPVVTHNTFTGNHAAEPADFSHDHNRRRQRGHNGGAIGLVNYSNPVIHFNLFVQNSTGVGYGAAIAAKDDCIPQIGYNVFWKNISGTNDRAVTRSSNGGAVALIGSSRAGIFHNLFVGNEVLGGSDGGAVFCEYFSWPEIRWNIFLNNYAHDDGGALDSQKFAHPKIKYNLFFGNRVDGSGGALHHDDSLMELENNIFAYNVANSQAGAFGGSHGWIRAVNNTVVYNKAIEMGGGAVHHYNMKNPYLKPIILRNNIFHGNEPDELFLESGGDVHYNIVQGGFGAAYGAYQIDPHFKKDQVMLPARSARFNEQAFRTRIEVSPADVLSPGSLVGRVIRRLPNGAGSASSAEAAVAAENRIERDEGTLAVTMEDGGLTGEVPQFLAHRAEWWSIIVRNGPDWIEVWGDLQLDGEASLEVVQTFHLAADSPAIDNGLYTDFAADDIDGQPRYTPTIDFGADEYVPEK